MEEGALVVAHRGEKEEKAGDDNRANGESRSLRSAGDRSVKCADVADDLRTSFAYDVVERRSS